MKTQQQADIDLALALIGDDWLDQNAFDAAARAHKAPSRIYGYSRDDFVPPINYCQWNRHIWGAQLAMRDGLVETRRRKGLVEYRRKQQEARV
jgi:hypothetical protein